MVFIGPGFYFVCPREEVTRQVISELIINSRKAQNDTNKIGIWDYMVNPSYLFLFKLKINFATTTDSSSLL